MLYLIIYVVIIYNSFILLLLCIYKLFTILLKETAINVGYSCQLLTDEMVDVFIVDGTTAEEVQQQLQKFRESIRIVNTYQPRSPANQQLGASNGGISGTEGGRVPSPPPAAQPPAVSVVTFRWDDAMIHTRQGRAAR